MMLLSVVKASEFSVEIHLYGFRIHEASNLNFLKKYTIVTTT